MNLLEASAIVIHPPKVPIVFAFTTMNFMLRQDANPAERMPSWRANSLCLLAVGSEHGLWDRIGPDVRGQYAVDCWVRIFGCPP